MKSRNEAKYLDTIGYPNIAVQTFLNSNIGHFLG